MIRKNFPVSFLCRYYNVFQAQLYFTCRHVLPNYNLAKTKNYMIKFKNLIKNKKLQLSVLVGLIFLFFIFLGFLAPMGKGSDKMITIEKGWGSGEVGQELKDNGLIRSKWLFVLYVWVKGYNNHLQAGEYALNPKMSLFEVSRIIADGKITPNIVKVTIPEGWNIKQINERLVSLGVISADDIIPQNEEGYLFPDTYYFYKNSSAQDVIKKMYDNLQSKLTNEIKEEMKTQDRSIDEILTMASILEKEVKSDEDRAIVSGIFWQRIADGMPLQADITIAYILGVDKSQYSYEETRIDSPYNTYLYRGLPPTPINNPGLSAIKAAIYPKFTDYVYFLSAPDGTTIYAKTLDEHNANKAKYLQ